MAEVKNPSVGDVVKLKSGGPAMTVKEGTKGGWTCMWFQDGNLQEATFPSSVLVSESSKR